MTPDEVESHPNGAIAFDTDTERLQSQLVRHVRMCDRGIIPANELPSRLTECAVEHARQGELGRDPSEVDDPAAWDAARAFVTTSDLPDAVKASILAQFDIEREIPRKYRRGLVSLQEVYDALEADPTNADLRERMGNQMLGWLHKGIEGDVGNRLLERMGRVASRFGLDRVFTRGLPIILKVNAPQSGRLVLFWQAEIRRIEEGRPTKDDA